MQPTNNNTEEADLASANQDPIARALNRLDGVSVSHFPSIAPSRPVNKINVPEVKSNKATFVYNYFTRDERSREEYSEEQNRIVVLDASESEEIFHRTQNKKLARYVKLEFTPPAVATSLIGEFDMTTDATELTNNLGKIIVEGAMSNQIFTGVELLDVGRERNIYNMLNSALFFTQTSNTRQSNKEKIQNLYEILDEKGGLHGADKKILLEAFRNIPPTNTGQGGYMLAESDVPPEIAQKSTDPIGKQTFSVQMNNLFMKDLLKKATEIPDSVFQDEIRAMIPISEQIKTEILGTISPDSLDVEADYDLTIPHVINEAPLPSNYNGNDYPQIKFAGYLIEKYEVLTDENVTFRGRKFIPNHNMTYAIDSQVRYGGSYFYRIRTVVRVKTIITSENTTNPSMNEKSSADFFIASEGVMTNVHCVENVPPPPPTNLHVKFNFQTLKPRVTWQFPLNKQRDIKRFQIFKRLSIDEPFRLLAEYDFDNSLIKSPVSEVAPEDKIFKFRRPRTFYTDISHVEGEKPIYAIASVDAHGLTSNYSAQVMVERDRYRNTVKRTIISREGAPKPYPNLFLNEDTFLDCIKVSNYDRIKIAFDPEYYRVLKTVTKTIDLGPFGEFDYTSERDLNLLAISNGDTPKYKFHFINIDNQKDQIVDVKIDVNASSIHATEGMFETSTANFNEENFSFQYGVE